MTCGNQWPTEFQVPPGAAVQQPRKSRLRRELCERHATHTQPDQAGPERDAGESYVSSQQTLEINKLASFPANQEGGGARTWLGMAAAVIVLIVCTLQWRTLASAGTNLCNVNYFFPAVFFFLI